MPLLPGGEEEIQAIVLQAGHQAYREYDFSRFPHCRVVLDGRRALCRERIEALDRKSTRLNSSHSQISYAVFCLKKKTTTMITASILAMSPSAISSSHS